MRSLLDQLSSVQYPILMYLSRASHFILPLSLSVFACDLHTSRPLASHLDWREPIGLQERLEGKELP